MNRSLNAILLVLGLVMAQWLPCPGHGRVVLGPTDAFAREEERPMIFQAMLGEQVIENDDPHVTGGDYNITLFGVAAQKPYFGEMVQAGIEVGMLLNWESDTRAYAASGGSGGYAIAVSVEINQFLADYFFGGYVSIQPVKWFRLYFGAGPLLIYGSRETDETDPDTSEVTTISESGFSAGGYGRAGLEFVFADKFMLGAGVRVTRTGLGFDENAGQVDIEGVQYFGILSFYF